jgi:cytoskeletal protein CcmA (bactofilin family)
MIKKDFYSKISEDVSAVIEKGCSFKGDLVFDGIARFGGEFEGKIFSNGTLIIEETGVVKADVNADTIVINGKFIGNIEARNKIEIFKSAVVKADLKAPAIVIEEGAAFDGKTSMI